MEDAVIGNQRAKIEQFEGSLFVVLKTLRYIEETSDIETGEVMLFIGDRFVVTVRRGEGNPLAGVRQSLERGPERLQHGPLAVLHAVMDSVVDNYLDVNRELSIDLDEIETQVLTADGVGDSSVIYRLKREVLEFKRASGPLEDTLTMYMDRGGGSELHVDVRHLFRDVADHLRQVNDHVESYDRLLSDILGGALGERVGATERRHAQDLGVGCHRGGADDDRRDLRDELRRHA